MGIFDLIIVQPIFNLLLVIYSLVGDFGVAIIIFTLIVKMLLWPLVKKQMHQTKSMRKIQPELAEIKKRCKGNRQMESLQMMDLYKKNNIKPFRSILILVAQLPIFIALFRVVSMITTPNVNQVEPEYGVEMRVDGGERVAQYAYGPVKSLRRVQLLINHHDEFEPRLFGLVDLNSRALPIDGWSSIFIWVVIIAAAVVQYYMARQQMPSKPSKRRLKDIMREAANGKEVDQSEVNGVVSGQMMKFLPLFLAMIMIQMPGALAFYFFVTNLVTATQQKIILRKGEEDMEVLADKKILKELRDLEKTKEAKIVKKSGKNKKKENVNVTRISASDKKRRRK